MMLALISFFSSGTERDAIRKYDLLEVLREIRECVTKSFKCYKNILNDTPVSNNIRIRDDKGRSTLCVYTIFILYYNRRYIK